MGAVRRARQKKIMVGRVGKQQARCSICRVIYGRGKRAVRRKCCKRQAGVKGHVRRKGEVAVARARAQNRSSHRGENEPVIWLI